MEKRLITELLAGLLILLFLYTALNKLTQFAAFISVLKQSPGLGGLARPVGWMIPCLEIIVAALLFLPRFRAVGFWGSSLLMVLFTGYILYMFLFAPRLPCSCGGIIKSMSWKAHLVFNITALLLSLIGWKVQHDTEACRAPGPRPHTFIRINRRSRKPATE